MRVSYSIDGERFTKTAFAGETLSFGTDEPGDELIHVNGRLTWLTPYPGRLSYATAPGGKKSVKVKAIPAPLDLSDGWTTRFPLLSDESRDVTFDTLTSWAKSQDEDIRYFSGTATYRKEFSLPRKWTDGDYALELDLGDVRVMAEVFLNGKNLGTLWKAPYRIDISGAIRKGSNVLEIKVTNLWPNAMIGDERHPVEKEWEGGSMREWPKWLDNPSSRASERETFSPRRVWGKDSKLLPSGLIGPVLVRPYKKETIK